MLALISFVKVIQMLFKEMQMQKKIRIIAVLLCAAGALCGCGKVEQTVQLGSKVWEKMPEATFGVLESEKLSVEAWNCGRAEETSDCSIVECRDGYYFLYDSMLYYADKERLDTWVPVCKKPDCKHYMYDDQCAAVISTNDITAKDGRLYFTDSLHSYAQLYSGKGSGIGVISMLPNGEDRRIDYYVEAGLLLNGGSYGSQLTTNYWLYLSNILEANGDTTVRLFRTDEAGTQKLFETVKGENEPASVLLPTRHTLGLNGEKLYYCGFFQEPGYYSFSGQVPKKVTIPEVPLTAGYLSGTTLRFFRQNDGYYDIDIETGEEVFLIEARLKNSCTSILLPNMILESTLLYEQSVKGRTLGMEHSMELFDGEQWRSVELPEDLQFASMSTYLYMCCVTSDSIWLKQAQYTTETRDGKEWPYLDMHLYRIDLSQKNLTLEYFGSIIQNRPK